MANTLDLPFSATKPQEPFLYKIKSGFSKFIGWRRPSFAVDTFRPSKYSPARQDSYTSDIHDSSGDDDDDDDDDEDDNDIAYTSELKHSIYSKDDDFERNRYNKAQHNRRASAITIQTPSSILVKSSSPSTHQHHHRHTKSLQNAPSHHHPHHHSRHTSHISFMSASNITVNSEDLTAKEFADITGIKIIPDTDDDDNNDDKEKENDPNDKQPAIMHSSTPSINGNQQQQQPRPSHYSYHAGDEHDWSVLSSGSMHSQSSTHIWDTGFWKRPDDVPPPPPPQQHLLPPSPSLRKHRSALLQHRPTLSLPPPIPPVSSSKSNCHHAKSKSTCDLPIVHELLRIHSNQPDPPVIRKGRFEVQLESKCPP